jgi:hypothetical protein
VSTPRKGTTTDQTLIALVKTLDLLEELCHRLPAEHVGDLEARVQAVKDEVAWRD